MSQLNSNQEFVEKFEHGRSQAMTGGSIVYTGVVILTTALFITFVLTAFPESAYFTRFVMVLGGIAVGGSMLAFPVALHKWAISGDHRTWAIALYYGEMFIVALNTLVSFSVLLAKFSGWTIPEWIHLYEPFTILGIVYTLFAWGTLFLTDPLARAQAKRLSAQQTLEEGIAQRIEDYLHTVEGEEAIKAHADEQIAAMMSMDRYKQNR